MPAYIYQPALFAILVSISSFVCSSVKADEIRTYQFVDNGEANLRFGGGLISGNSFASPTGQFDITIAESGSATITRFDVDVTNVIVKSDGASLFREGDSLASFFFGVEPIGLMAQINSSIVFSSRPDVLEFIGVFSPSSPFVDISLSSLQDSEVSVFIWSYSGYFLDNPNLSTTGTGSRAILVAVPEPCGLTLFASLSLLLLHKRRALPVV